MMRPGPRPIERQGRLALLLCCLLLLTACETLNSRLTRNQALLATFPAEHQSLIRQGQVAVGFSQAEVYLAWGAPSHKTFTENTRGHEEAWLYTTIQTETTYREERYYDPRFDSWQVIDRPYQRSFEVINQEAIFSNDRLDSFTLYPSPKPYGHRPW